ncbi:MAG: M24 family metallopeptidase, partial [Planctomycetota bacterium]|nr:M24 family metallopeptidase [Planctomycetota bacterium]
SLPHARAGEKKVEKNCVLLMDFGAHKDMYNCDITRTMFRGKVPEKLHRIYRIVAEAQRLALDAIRPGLAVRTLDKIARGYIKARGYGKEFGHSLGHGIGREVHEAPRISWKTPRVKLQEGMVFTVEPGIYLPGVGGVRIEDTVLVTKTGCEILTAAAPKEKH